MTHEQLTALKTLENSLSQDIKLKLKQQKMQSTALLRECYLFIVLVLGSWTIAYVIAAL